MRKDLTCAVSRLFAGLAIPRERAVDGDEKRRLIALATLAVRCRSAVERDSHSREVELIPESEAPGRLALALARLLAGVTLIGAARPEAWRVVGKAALDCVPALRLRVIRVLSGASVAVDTTTVATAVRYPTQTTRRALEDLTAHGVVKRQSRGSGKADEWQLSNWTIKKCADACIAFPKMSEDDYVDQPSGAVTFPGKSEGR